MKKKVTIIGSYNVGFFFKGDRLPVTGETIMGREFIEGGGGKGSNQAVAAASFGADTCFIGKLGADKYAIDALNMYKKRGISIDHIKIEPGIHSGMSVMIIDEKGNNLISVVPGANFLLSPKDIDEVEDVLRSSMFAGFQLENDHNTVFYGIRKAKECGATTFLDPAPASPLPDDLYPFIDIIKPNETEATILTGIKVNNIKSAIAAGHWFIKKGVTYAAIITLGEQGALLVTSDSEKHFPAPDVKAIDTTGAGDIFSGSFLASLSQNRSLEESIRHAICAASLSTTRIGVIEAIPTIEESEIFYSQNCK